MDAPVAERHILDWDEGDVQNWLASLGYPQYESQIRGPRLYCISNLIVVLITT